MPCYQVNTISVSLKAKNKNLVLEALKQLNLTYRTLPNNKISISHGYYTATLDLDNEVADVVAGSGTQLLNQIKRTYSRLVIEEVAKKKKWLLKKQRQTNKLQLRRY